LAAAPADPASAAPGGDSSKRFFLHARHIKLSHPTTHKTLSIEAPLPPDFERLIASLEV
jgi:23S rRNA-/tRNA-specific pseudouridylate synthase